MLAQIYIGCKCGETWHVSSHQECDDEHDEVYTILTCTICNTEVTGQKIVDGSPHIHALTDEEIESERNKYYYDAIDDILRCEDDDDF